MRLRHFYILGFSALVLLDTLTQISLKLTANHAGPFAMTWDYLQQVVLSLWIYIAAFGYLGAFFTWMTLLKHAPVGPAFAASHLEVVTVLVLSVLLFDERLAPVQIVGCLCIVAGIVLLGVSESKHPHA